MKALRRYIEPRRLLQSLALPTFFACTAVALALVWYVLGLPRDQELAVMAKRLFDTYGYIALFVSAVFEGALVVGLYYPGSFVIFLSVILAGGDVPKLVAIMLIVTCAFVIGLSADYVLGRYGWYRLLLRLGLRHEMEKAEQRLAKHGLLAIFFTYWDANVASFTATAAGVLRYPYRSFLFYSVIALLIWNTVWTVMLVLIGQGALELVSGNPSYVLAVVLAWSCVIVVVHIIKNILSRREEGAQVEGD